MDTVSVLVGNGDGSFKARQAFAVGNGPRSVTTGDFNGDGVADLVSADYYTAAVSVLLGNGDGSFKSRQAFTVGNRAYFAAVSDFNGDGAIDIVNADHNADTLSVLLGNGDGSFKARQLGRETCHFPLRRAILTAMESLISSVVMPART